MTTEFILGASVLVLLAAVFLARPLLWRLAPTQAGSPVPLAPVPQSRGAALAVTLPPTLGSAALYGVWGNRSWLATPAANATGDPGEPAIAALARHLEQQPGDQSGWLSLGAAYNQIGEHNLALRAYERANRLSPDGYAPALAGMGESLLTGDDESQAARGAEYIERALVLDPHSPKALFYGAILAYRQGQLELSRQRFEAMLALSPPENVRAAVQKEIDDIDAQMHPRLGCADRHPTARP